MVRIAVQPDVLRWARQRSRLSQERLASRFPKLADWESGAAQPTLKQLEDFAAATHTPTGFLFLPAPPDERLPIPDYRTLSGQAVEQPSPDLLETIQTCEHRQEWFRAYAATNRADPLGFVGSIKLGDDVEAAAHLMSGPLGFGLEQRREFPSWTAALSGLSERAEDAGVLVMISGVVGSNTHRPLDPEEFRGFALVDRIAPLVFINGADTKAAQIFTLAHELVHIWLGQSALSNDTPWAPGSNAVEHWSNQVAAELLVPIDDVRSQFRRTQPLDEEAQRLATRYRVSTIVALRRLRDGNLISPRAYKQAYDAAMDRFQSSERETGTGGGNFYNTLPVRTSKRFTRAVLASTLEGRTPYTEAFAMLGFRKMSTFQELARRLAIGR
jgi:Zn-dependent peptidase ImmA (M78 family)/transcriptional regulator with XRE-family HTH domain